jgi:hypothetical protein
MTSESAKLRGFDKDFGEEYFSSDGRILFCKLCEVKVTAGKRFNVQQHCDMEKHKNILSRQTNHQSRQRLLFDNTATPSPSNKTSEFSKDLCEMMVSANIPLNKVDNEQFKTFLEKYTTYLIPDESTLRKNYVIFSYFWGIFACIFLGFLGHEHPNPSNNYVSKATFLWAYTTLQNTKLIALSVYPWVHMHE